MVDHSWISFPQSMFWRILIFEDALRGKLPQSNMSANIKYSISLLEITELIGIARASLSALDTDTSLRTKDPLRKTKLGTH